MTNDFPLRWSPLLPGWVNTALLLGLAAALVFGTIVLVRRGVPRSSLVFVTLVRLGCLALFALILLQPTFSLTHSEPDLPELVVLVDRSASMGLPTKDARVSRWQEVNDVLGSHALGTSLREKFHVHWHTFAATLQAEKELDASTKPEGPTRLADSLEGACLQERSLGKQIDRVLLVSDGADHGTRDVLEAARNLGVRVDVLPPSPAAQTGPDLVEIVDVQSARRVLLGSETHFRLTLRRPRAGTGEKKIPVSMVENGKVVFERSLTMKAGVAEQTFFLPHRPETKGLANYEFLVAAGDKELQSVVQRSLEVIDQHYEVLILEDTWRWEYKYLHRLFEDDPSFRFTALLARGGGAFVQFASPDRRVNLIGFPQNQAELERFDMFFLGDVNPVRWPAGMAATLGRLVSEEGKSLVVIAGPQLGQIVNYPELHRLLPVELSPESGRPVEGPIEVRQRSEATSSPFFFQLRGGTDQLPPFDRVYPTVRKRPGATILLEAAKERNTYGNLIVLAEQTVGRGRVLFVGTDTLWKWHTLAPPGEGPTPYSTFWQQAFRALTPGRTSLQGIQLWLTPQRTRVEVGQPVVVEAEVDAGRPVPGAKVQGAVTLPDQRRVPVVFTVDPANPQRYRTEFTSPLSGLHTLAAQLAVDNAVAVESSVSLQVEETGDESRDVVVDMPSLSRLAQATGGKVVDPERHDTWPEPANLETRQIERAQVIDLWQNFTLLLVLTGLLAADWFYRLFKGLV